MESGLTSSSALALFTAMAVLAAMPSTSVFAVSARAAGAGFRHGALTAAGVVLGDLIFVLFAICGLAMLVDALGAAFVLVKYAGGVYLLWLGLRIWRARRQRAEPESGIGGESSLSSFMTGLLITLGDQKAVLFYLGFLPAFLDLSALTVADAAGIVAITVVAVGGVKLVYAWAAVRAGQVFGHALGEAMNRLSAVILFAAGLWVIVRA